MKNYTIAVAGTGYVGLSIATLLAQHHEVIAVDVVPEKVDKINRRISPIQDEYIEKYLTEKNLHLTATLDGEAAYRKADFIVIAAPTNYDPVKNYFDTSHVEEVIDLALKVNPDAVLVIKSTIPVGYCRSLYVKYARQFKMSPALQGKRFNLLFSPEFLRESKALYDNLYPSRIIVGYPKIIQGRDQENEAIRAIAGEHLEEKAHEFAALLQEGAIKDNIDTLFMGLKEAEAVKLFANTSLALRVSYFNELDKRAGYASHHRRHLSRPPHRHPLQQPVFRLRRLLPAQGHQAAACQLSGRARKPDSRHCRIQSHEERFHSRPGFKKGGLL